MKRKKIDEKIKQKIRYSVANCCCLCGQYLYACHIHHIKFLADGGGNSFDNFVALCPTCHYGLAHSQRSSYDIDNIELRRNSLRKLVSIEREILYYISIGEILEAGNNFVRTDYLHLATLFGRYNTSIAIGNKILSQINKNSLCGQLVSIVILELSMYTHEEQKYLDRVENALVLQPGRLEPDFRTRAHISVSRAYGRNNLSYERQKWLLTSDPPEGMESLVRYREAEYQRRDGNTSSAISTIDSVLKKINVEDSSDRLISPSLLLKGRALEENGSREEARASYDKSIEFSMKLGANRGVFLSSLHMAKLVLRDDIEEAKYYFSLASPYIHTKRNTDIIYNKIFLELIRSEN